MTAPMTRKATVTTLGDRIRHAREQQGLTQFELASRAGIRPEVLNRIERGKSVGALGSLHKLAPLLSISIEELVGLRGTTPAITKPASKAESGKKGKRR
jgi:transcriptional regulator with XRE-family HTH domain